MPSFDIISEVNQVEVRNALDQVNKELSTRFDFKGSDARVEHKEKELTLYADDDFKLKQVTDVLTGKLAKRGIDLRSLKYGTVEKMSGDKVKQGVTIRVGVEQELAKKIVKLFEGQQAQGAGEAFRATRCACPARSGTSCRTRSRWSRNRSPTFPSSSATSATEHRGRVARRDRWSNRATRDPRAARFGSVRAPAKPSTVYSG